MKLTTLKPRIQTLSTARLMTIAAQPAPVQRLRGSAGVKDRAAIRKRDCDLCQACKRKGVTRLGDVVDHIHPLHLGGSDDSTNKELLCNPCHDAKSASEAGDRSRGVVL